MPELNTTRISAVPKYPILYATSCCLWMNLCLEYFSYFFKLLYLVMDQNFIALNESQNHENLGMKTMVSWLVLMVEEVEA